jgi:glycosyltransferase involved in cell wall biosynthesis
MRKKILHFRIWPSPPIAVSVEKLLRETFPEYELEIVTLAQRIKADKWLLIRNTLEVLRQYGCDILRGRLDFKAAYFRTIFLFDRVRRMAQEIGRGRDDIAFTFQLQSIFDTHLEGIPHFVYTDHTQLANLLYSPHMKVRLYSAEWISREKNLYMNAERIFTRSSNISRSLLEQYGIPAERVCCVYAGANTPTEAIDAEKKDYSLKNILFVGLDWERKGGPELLRAFEQVRRRHTDANLVIAGARVKTDLAGVIALGRVPVAELKRYYREATVFCMPSRSEPFGVAYVEAMAYALPIVATEIGALPDMVSNGKNGFLVQPGDVNSLAQALDSLLSDKQKRARFGKISRRLAAERYNWDAVGKSMRKSIEPFLPSRQAK